MREEEKSLEEEEEEELERVWMMLEEAGEVVEVEMEAVVEAADCRARESARYWEETEFEKFCMMGEERSMGNGDEVARGGETE